MPLDRKEYLRKYWFEHKEQQKLYRQTHRTKLNEYARNWYNANKELVSKRQKQYRLNDLERYKNYECKSRKKCQPQRAIYRQLNKTKINEQKRNYYITHKEQILKKQRETSKINRILPCKICGSLIYNCSCRRLKRRQYRMKHQRTDVKSINKRNRGGESATQKIIFYTEYKKTHSCELCGEKDIACLVFHHKDKNNKLFELSSYKTKSIKLINDEILKCQVLCANCHSKIHFYRGEINK